MKCVYRCECDPTYTGDSCQFSCVHGDLTFNPSSPAVCRCRTGWTGFECDLECSGHGRLLATMCACTDTWRGDLCDIPACPGRIHSALHGCKSRAM